MSYLVVILAKISVASGGHGKIRFIKESLTYLVLMVCPMTVVLPTVLLLISHTVIVLVT